MTVAGMGERKDPQGGAFLPYLLQEPSGSVRRPVVDDPYLGGYAEVRDHGEPVTDRADKELFLVVRRNDDDKVDLPVWARRRHA